MRQTISSGSRTALHAIIIVNIVVYGIQAMSLTWWGSAWVQQYFAMSIPAVWHGYLWTPITYAFVHSPHHILHILLNMAVIYFVGRALEPVLNRRHFLLLYFMAIFGGALFYFIVNYAQWQITGIPQTVPVVGASAAACGLLIYFCCLQPNQPVTFLLFFIIPMTLKPKWIAVALVSFDLFGLLFFELSSSSAGFGLAHSAHLGGMAFAWLCFRTTHRLPSRASMPRPSAQRTSDGWFIKRKRKGPAPSGKFTLHMSNRKDLQTEVDRILDKINEQGFGALTEEEKETLDKARELLR